jgi:hypothetical protein
MSKCRQSLTLTQNGLSFLLGSALPTQGTVCQPHYVVMCSQRVMSVTRSVATLDCVLLKNSSTIFAAVRGPEINSRACLWVLGRPCHSATCWLASHHWVFFIFSLETPRGGSGPTNWWTETSLASSSSISFPRVPECSGTQTRPTEW